MKDIKSVLSEIKIFSGYGEDYIFRDFDGKSVEKETAELSIRTAFMNILLGNKKIFEDNVKSYAQRDMSPKPFGVCLTIEGSKYVLTPSFGGFGMAEIRYQFTALLNMDYEICSSPNKIVLEMGNIVQKKVNNKEDALEMAKSAAFLVNNSFMKINSIATNVTNWDTDYGLHVYGAKGELLKSIISWFTDITNQDKSNIINSKDKKTFDLTRREEVCNCMQRLGLFSVYRDAVLKIKNFEDDNGLKRKSNVRENYKKKNTMSIKEDLSQYRDMVMNHIANETKGFLNMNELNKVFVVKKELCET